MCVTGGTCRTSPADPRLLSNVAVAVQGRGTGQLGFKSLPKARREEDQPRQGANSAMGHRQTLKAQCPGPSRHVGSQAAGLGFSVLFSSWGHVNGCPPSSGPTSLWLLFLGKRVHTSLWACSSRRASTGYPRQEPPLHCPLRSENGTFPEAPAPLAWSQNREARQTAAGRAVRETRPDVETHPPGGC